MGNLQENYEVHLVRNEEVYKIYNFDNGEGFQPDFLLLLKAKKQKTVKDQYLHYQIFIEPKGDHLKEKDRWKADFLQEITEKFGKDKIILDSFPNYRLIGLPFYLEQEENGEFVQKFDEII